MKWNDTDSYGHLHAANWHRIHCWRIVTRICTFIECFHSLSKLFHCGLGWHRRADPKHLILIEHRSDHIILNTRFSFCSSSHNFINGLIFSYAIPGDLWGLYKLRFGPLDLLRSNWVLAPWWWSLIKRFYLACAWAFAHRHLHAAIGSCPFSAPGVPNVAVVSHLPGTLETISWHTALVTLNPTISPSLPWISTSSAIKYNRQMKVSAASIPTLSQQ